MGHAFWFLLEGTEMIAIETSIVHSKDAQKV
jgi:hypothetical protein